MRYFHLSEFDSPDVKGSGVNMNKDFLVRLENARDIARVPFVITSGYRTKSHNKKVGGLDNSSHLRGYAVDIAAVSSPERYAILNALLKVGINRIGIGSNFIHCDMDPEKSKNVIWTY